MKQLVDGFAPDVLFEALKLHINHNLIRFVEGVNQPGACLDYDVSRILETDPTPIAKQSFRCIIGRFYSDARAPIRSPGVGGFLVEPVARRDHGLYHESQPRAAFAFIIPFESDRFRARDRSRRWTCSCSWRMKDSPNSEGEAGLRVRGSLRRNRPKKAMRHAGTQTVTLAVINAAP
jgi:hypothetical protein